MITDEIIAEAIRRAEAGEKPRCEWKEKQFGRRPVWTAAFGAVVQDGGAVEAWPEPVFGLSASSPLPGWTVTAAQIACELHARGLLLSPAERAAPRLLACCEELAESAAYWGEYDVPLGIVDRLKAAIAKAKGEQG